MYSIILMMGMTTPAALPADRVERAMVEQAERGILFNRNRGGCNGAQAVAVAAVGSGCNGAAAGPRLGLFAAVNDARPHVLRRLLGRRSAGCAGGQAFASVATGCSGNVALAAGCAGSTMALPRTTGCSGGTLTLGARPTTITLSPAQPAGVGEAVGGARVQRAAVHRQLRRALRQGGGSGLTEEQIRFLESHNDAYDMAVGDAHKILLRAGAMTQPAGLPGAASPQPQGAATAGALGDGHVLQLLLANLPAIIDAIKQILALFGH